MMERDKRLTGHKRGQKVRSELTLAQVIPTINNVQRDDFVFSLTQCRLKDLRPVASGLQSLHDNLPAHHFVNVTIACLLSLYSSKLLS